MYVYLKVRDVFEVGFYRPDGAFNVTHVFDGSDEESVIALVARLNGGDASTLLDLFAGQALAGYISSACTALLPTTSNAEMDRAARTCFCMSMAMLRVRPEFLSPPPAETPAEQRREKLERELRSIYAVDGGRSDRPFEEWLKVVAKHGDSRTQPQAKELIELMA